MTKNKQLPWVQHATIEIVLGELGKPNDFTLENPWLKRISEENLGIAKELLEWVNDLPEEVRKRAMYGPVFIYAVLSAQIVVDDLKI